MRAAGQQTIVSKIVGRQPTTAATVSSHPSSGAGSPAAAAAGSNAGGAAANGNGHKGSPTAVFETTSQTVGTAELANDHGFSGWLGMNAGSNVDFQVGYTRSIGYDLNTVFAGIGFRFGR